MPEFKPKRVIRPGDEVDHVLQQQLYKYTKHYVENLYFGPNPNEDKPQTVFKGARIIKLDNKYAPQILKGSQLKIYPYTIVNLLGKYGDFETDSNGDGLADGWCKTGGTDLTYSLETEIVSSKAQKILNETGTDTGFQLGFCYNTGTTYKFSVSEGDIFFISVYVKTDTQGMRIKFLQWDDTGGVNGYSNSFLGGVSKWERVYLKEQILTGTVSVSFHLNSTDVNDDIDNGHYWLVDGYAAYNLTAMGALPLAMQEYYGVTNWSDLDEDTLAQLLPFCNGICTLGFIWAGDL